VLIIQLRPFSVSSDNTAIGIVSVPIIANSHQEFLKFLKRLDAEFPVEKQLHLVMDNYGTHKHPNVQKWLSRHPRFVMHFIPTSSSWERML
jgi:transposase